MSRNISQQTNGPGYHFHRLNIEGWNCLLSRLYCSMAVLAREERSHEIHIGHEVYWSQSADSLRARSRRTDSAMPANARNGGQQVGG
jgi:hypothetical protein